ncbi:glutamine--fructose-6-phosphate transaminase (isomerizing) [Gemmatimonas sp.]|jgi:glucosamine--fructose-6-phosphate aminotransferase (isomerizing)|uniref:glutamine--fructose-6-phosphate transaminase (isomerizing) n=1 Tax=Gemmatimonas sp. TaxID=1962908 RepID=UPI0022C74AB9|nr:glutamine--fructose-6-phosphate transaminase (isomerizing) [Gemmatimonas sp.]MCA2983628.1 glutamine--fructose-6-phosphate transaminase (isomerizing) [Gemmatimonas sp.]MCA2987735.1 glutamine--fructose-6-phosphate transaminase (isomerizing) [Gemmatimonas sp.]MCA2990197.1 glutamine--fructose-6-phosphate transaminase (isomerizing) [Gemmatimonas sp.]MCA2995353.1 glutamine--fructose-6-phosphate transaminase (isomerizing) [Gemmatimonas sp.]MCZ8012228.1 glutamine--fructose-6-phosphate transaminase 
MCGIVGYVGDRVATPMLIEGLKRLEYRGYDSAGVAIMNGKGVETRRAAGKIARLESVIAASPPHGTLGIAHTRWATHGPPTENNAHPHVSQNGKIAVVHNGIIENATVLKAGLEARGYVFKSDTDTEVLAHLIETAYAGNLEAAVIEALRQVDGTYGIAVISSDEKDKMVAARKGSPLLVGIGEGENFIASDASAILSHTRHVVYLDDGDIAVVTKDGYRVLDLDSVIREKPVTRIEWDLAQIERGGYPHFMLKEIFEQPTTVENTMRGRLILEEGFSKLGGLNISKEDLLAVDNIIITACGTSWHSALIGEMMIEELCRIPVEVEYASEFRYRNPIVTPRTLCIVISQSGETADTLAAMREAKRRGARTLGLVNVVGSTIAREDDGGIYLHAGPEIGVASTKAFTSQVVALALFTLKLARLRDLSVARGREIAQALANLPAQIQSILDRAEEIEALAEEFKRASNFLYLGRGYNFPAALEGALKLKEISYIHAEGYPAAEMKHGPIALIDEMMPVVCIAPHDAVFDKITSNIQEVKARRGKVIAITTRDEPSLAGKIDYEFRIPETVDLLSPILASVPLQLLAYYIAVKRGCNVDQPRNLAKSVTVE